MISEQQVSEGALARPPHDGRQPGERQERFTTVSDEEIAPLYTPADVVLDLWTSTPRCSTRRTRRSSPTSAADWW
jgi:hypothetical protein